MSLFFSPEYGRQMQLTQTGLPGVSIEFNHPTNANTFVLDPNECSGLDSPEVREEVADKVEQDGAIQGQNFYGKRSIVLGGVIKATSVAERNIMMAQLMQVSNALRGNCTLSWTPVEGPRNGVFVTARRAQPLRITGGYVKKFQLALTVADPRIYDNSNQVVNMLSPNAGLILETGKATGLDDDSTWLYMANNTTGQVDAWRLDGSEPRFGGAVSVAASTYGVAVVNTEANKYLFWSEPTKGAIGRGSLPSKTSNNPVINPQTKEFITGLGEPKGLFSDGTFIYWADTTKNSIGRAKLDGTEVLKEFIKVTVATAPIGVAVDATKIYWTATGGTGVIGRANLNGTGIEESWVTSPTTPDGITLDSEFLYWAEKTGAGFIGRVKIGGTEPLPEWITTPTVPRGVVIVNTILGKYIYWGDETGTQVGRQNFNAYSLLNNEGLASTYPYIKVYGETGATWEIKNATTGETVKVEEKIPAGRYAKVDFVNRLVIRDDGVNLYSKFSFTASKWWSIQPSNVSGPVKVEILPTNQKVEVEFRNAWI